MLKPASYLAVLRDSPPSLNLSVPLLALQRPRPNWRARQLSSWVQDLPFGNIAVAGQQLLEKLRLLNRSRYPAKERLQLHNCLRPALSGLLHTMRQPLRQARIPLDRRQRYNADLQQQLLEEMAAGYKIVVMELALSDSSRESSQMLLHEASYLAAVYLSQRLIEAYSLYSNEPAQVWSDLNQLYLYAETRNFHTRTVDDPYPDTPLPIKASLDHAYKRIILLALAEPYHLMQYETADIYRIIANFIESCVLEPFTQLVMPNEYLIDLDADRGPYYVSSETEIKAAIPRLVDISAVKEQLGTHLQRLLRSNIQHADLAAVSLVERQQRDMLLRLADAWDASLQRKAQRFNLGAKVELTSGLNAGHFFISDGAIFTPEIDALRLTQGPEKLDDNTHTIFASSYREALQKDRRHSHQGYTLNPWWQRNISPIGIALNARDIGRQLDVGVGELAVYRFCDKPRQRWQIGVIRWLKTSYNEAVPGIVNIGIMNLANGAFPVGIKAIKGLGIGTDYFRGLLIPKQISLQQTRSLIVPALLYDVGSVLVMNLRQRLTYVHLTRMLLSTSSFTQFEFTVVEKPTDFTL